MPDIEQYDELIKALDDYRSERDEWAREVSRSGFYDPQGFAEQHAKEKIQEAVGRLDKAFRRIVLEIIDTREGP